jgi:hypothetical protein
MRHVALRRSALSCGLALGFWCGFVDPALAAPVAPGETIQIDDDAVVQTPTGDVLAEDVRPVTFNFELRGDDLQFREGEGTMEGTFTSRVIREAGRSGLTFLFETTIDEEFYERTQARVGSFGGFDTDVEASIPVDDVLVSRSADGQILTFGSAGELSTTAGTLVVIRTDAESFDADGSFEFDIIGREFFGVDINDPEEGRLTGGDATLLLEGTFQPTAGGNGGAVIPLPAALVPGLLTLGGIAAGGGARRLWRGRRRA